MDTRYKFCSEFYVVEKTIIVVVKMRGVGRHIKIEALLSNSGEYSARSYIEEHITVQSSYPAEAGQKLESQSMSVWASFDLPWVDAQKTADLALDRALLFLSERCSD